MAYVLCILVGFGLLMSPFAETEHAAVDFVFVLVALPMFFSWVGLLGIHLGRILTGQYNLATALVALFVPLLGLAWVSLRLPRSMN